MSEPALDLGSDLGPQVVGWRILLTAVLVTPLFGDLLGRVAVFGDEDGGQFCDVVSRHLMFMKPQRGLAVPL